MRTVVNAGGNKVVQYDNLSVFVDDHGAYDCFNSENKSHINTASLSQAVRWFEEQGCTDFITITFLHRAL